MTIQLAFLLFVVHSFFLYYLTICDTLFPAQSFHISSAPQIKPFQVYYLPKCAIFNTTQRFAQNVTLL